MACARASSLERLQKLLQRHAYVLMPSVLDILACLPETLHPSVLQDLLPKVRRCALLAGAVICLQPGL